MLTLTGQVAIVTGGGSGIGRAIARAIAAAGAQVVVADILPKGGRETVELIAQAGGSAMYLSTDVSRWEDVDRLVAVTEENYGPLDILANCAGVFDGYAGCEETTEALWDRVIGINLRGAFLMCKRALQSMAQRGRGSIINVSSVAAERGSADGLSYTVSKAGLVGLTKRLAVEYAERGINVNAILPGVIETPIRQNSAEVLGEVAPPMQRGVGVSPELFRALVPANRRGQPEEVAALAVFLASDLSRYIHGQAIAVDGGWTAA